MSTFPYHVVGGSFSANPMAIKPVPAKEISAPASTRRRKLWELSHKCHCPVIGTCFEVAELRSLLKKVLDFPRDTSDFVLHTTAVGACESRSAAAELLHKQLEKRYPLAIRKFSAARDSKALGALWREAVAAGNGIPAALWATLSHPACDATLEHEVYADIHMIQHQIGSGNRADLKTLKQQREEISELRRQLEKARQENEAMRAERSTETQSLAQRIVELRAELAGSAARFAQLTGQYEELRSSLPELRERQSLRRRAADAEARNQALTAQAASHETELRRLREQLQTAEEMIVQLSRHDEAPEQDGTRPEQAGERLSGKCVLCVGGRAGMVEAYRDLVEQSGGRFIHHDGGLEESLHRIDGALTAADLVICQAGCISHNAYWRVKEQCKRTGKRCVFVRNTGVSSFGRGLDEAMES
jgi:hypothetical protein